MGVEGVMTCYPTCLIDRVYAVPFVSDGFFLKPRRRLNGRELDGMNSAELALLVNQIQRGLLDLQEQRLAPTMEQMARKRREVCNISLL